MNEQDYMVDDGDLEVYKKKRDLMSGLAGVSDAMNSGHSFGEFMLGRMDNHQPIQPGIDKYYKDNDPRVERERSADLLAKYQAAKNNQMEMAKNQRESDLNAKYDDPMSPESQGLASQLKTFGLKIPDGVSGTSILKTYGQPAQYFKAKMESQLEDQRRKADADRSLQNELIKMKQSHLYDMESGKNMPTEDRAVVSTLATKNANKLAIANQIDSVMDGWDKMKGNQKVAAGRQLLKVLNSTEGADAIGKEEAERLGSKIEFAMGNMTNTNPMQFGRDLPGFKEQALNTSKAIRGAIQQNAATIEKITGRKSKMSSPEPKTPHPQDSEAVQWAKQNPKDPRAITILKANGL